MWNGYEGICEIIPITNAQNQKFWQDEIIKKSWINKDIDNYKSRKFD
jgi:starch phosphorylase